MHCGVTSRTGELDCFQGKVGWPLWREREARAGWRGRLGVPRSGGTRCACRDRKDTHWGRERGWNEWGRERWPRIRSHQDLVRYWAYPCWFSRERYVGREERGKARFWTWPYPFYHMDSFEFWICECMHTRCLLKWLSGSFILFKRVLWHKNVWKLICES